MSVGMSPAEIKFEQRLLACGGFYPADKIDGGYGPLTQKAERDAAAAFGDIARQYGLCDARSEKNIATLMPRMQVKAREIIKAANAWALKQPDAASTYTFAVLSGTRTYAEQDALFAKRPKVTNARGGQSNHNFGIAIDIGIFKSGKYLTGANRAEEKAYADVAAFVKQHVDGIEWGGDWTSFKDAPHYQLKTGLTLAQMRKQFEAGNFPGGVK